MNFVGANYKLVETTPTLKILKWSGPNDGH